mgnify:CR=1 FL=1
MSIENQRSSRQKQRRWMLLFGFMTLVLLSGCAAESVRQGYNWAWWSVSPFTETGRRNLSFLAQGLVPTLSLTGAAFGISIPLGLIVSLIYFVPHRIAKSANRIYVELLRSVPMLVMILWVYYGLPVSVGIDLNVFAAGVVALALIDSAFEAEIFRGGIQSIAADQLETARSLGLTSGQTLRYIVMPQAIRRILPPLGNRFVLMLKVSSLVSVIGAEELTRRANELTVSQYRPLEIYTVLIVEYLILVALASAGVRYLERKLQSTYQE